MRRRIDVPGSHVDIEFTSAYLAFFGRPFVKTVRPVLSDLCPVQAVLSVTLVYCGQTVGWIKTKLDMHVGLGPGHTVFDGDPASVPKGAQPSPNFRPISVAAKCLDGS